MRFLLIIAVFMLNQHFTKAQINLVPNPSFEIYDTCPSINKINLTMGYYSGINNAVPWFQPHITTISTDYFNACDTNVNFCDVPDNFFGYQNARTGIAYAGIATGKINPSNNLREYLEVQLNDSLLSNKKYCVSFFVNLSNFSATSIDKLGAYLSKNSVRNSDFLVINLSPQIINISGNIISDTLTWTKISGEFFAIGGERYITIGNFYDDANTNYIRNSYGTHLNSYYYIDDVSVILCDSTVSLNESIDEKSFIIFPNPSNGIFDLSFENKNQSIQLNIYSIEGKLLRTFNTADSKTQIDLSELNSGIYLLEIVCEDKKAITKKIVITH